MFVLKAIRRYRSDSYKMPSLSTAEQLGESLLHSIDDLTQIVIEEDREVVERITRETRLEWEMEAQEREIEKNGRGIKVWAWNATNIAFDATFESPVEAMIFVNAAKAAVGVQQLQLEDFNAGKEFNWHKVEKPYWGKWEAVAAVAYAPKVETATEPDTLVIEVPEALQPRVGDALDL